MKTQMAGVTLLVIVFSLMGGVSCQEFECESWGNGTCVEELYPYPYDCSQYIQCTAGCQAFVRNCPPGLEFSPTVEECLDPEVANCEVSTTVAPNTTTPLMTTTTPQPSDTTTINTPPSTSPGETTTTPPFNPSMFFVARDESTTTNGIINFTKEITDRHGDFNIDTDQFVAPSNGIYFFNLNAGIHPDAPGNMRMAFTDSSKQWVNARRTSNAHNGRDMSSRDIIYHLNTDDTLFIQCPSPSGLFSDYYYQTSWGGFSLHDTMEFVSAFSAGNFNPVDTQGPVDFQRILVNANYDFDGTTYTAPRDGLYFFAISVGVDISDAVNVALTVNGEAAVELLREGAWQNNDDTFSRSALLNLTAGDQVEYTLLSGRAYSTERLMTSFSGFYYKPKFTDTVAWFVSSTTSWESTGGSALNPLPYDNVLLNVGGAFNAETTRFVVPQSGFYYLHIGAGVRDAIFPNNGRVNMLLLIFNRITIDLRRDVTNHQGVDTMSRGVVVHLIQGDAIQVSAAANSGFHGDETRHLTYFLGMLIYSTE